MSRATILRYVARSLLLLGVVAGVVALLTGRVLVEGERELRTAEALATSGHLEDATVHARRAAAWYAPGAPHVAAAYARLVGIARLAESRGDLVTALYAWRSLRAGAWSSRWLLVPHREELALADENIARLAAKQSKPAYGRQENEAESQRSIHLMLSQRHSPRIPWIAVLLTSFAALSAGFLHMGLRGFDSRSARYLPRQLRFGGAILIGGLCAWIAALYNA